MLVGPAWAVLVGTSNADVQPESSAWEPTPSRRTFRGRARSFSRKEAVTMDAIKCKTCDTGTLTRRAVYRMSSVVVFIGYIVLVPSILGMILGVATCFGVAGKGQNDAATGLA